MILSNARGLARGISAAALMGAAVLLAGEALAQTTTVTTSISRTETVTAVTAPTIRNDTFETRVTGEIMGGALLFDQTYPEAFSGAGPQSGVAQARVAITSAGGPGVVIVGPTRVERSETMTISSTNTTRVVTALADTQVTEVTVGPTGPQFGTLHPLVGDRGLCQTPGTTTTSPGNCSGGTPLVLTFGDTNINTNTNTHSDVTDTTQLTETWRIFEHWGLFGTVQAFGMAHTAVQSSALDANSRFLRRMGDEASLSADTGSRAAMAAAPGFAADSSSGIRVWAEGYGVWSKSRASGDIPGDERAQYGFAAGIAGNLTPKFTLGLGIDHGNTDVRLNNGFERGDIRLSQFGLYAGYATGPWFANLAGTFGLGEADTQHSLLGLTTATYDLTTAGVLGEAGYRMQWGDWRVTPSLGFDYTSVRSDGFTELGQSALTAPAHTADRARAWVGLDVSQRLGSFDWSVYGRVVGVISGDERLLPVTFYNVPMTVTGVSEAKIGGDAGTRLSYKFAPGAELFARYDGRFRDGFTAHAASGGVKATF